MEEHNRLPARIGLEDFTEAVTRSALRALAAQRVDDPARFSPEGSIGLTIRCGIWFEITEGGVRGPVGQGGPEGPMG